MTDPYRATCEAATECLSRLHFGAGGGLQEHVGCFSLLESDRLCCTRGQAILQRPCGTQGSTGTPQLGTSRYPRPERLIIICLYRTTFFSQSLQTCAVRFALSAGPKPVGRSGLCRPRSAPPRGRSTAFVTGWKVQIHYGIETADRFWLANPLALCAGDCQMTYRTATMSDRRHCFPSTTRPHAHHSRCRRPPFSPVLRSPTSPGFLCALELRPRSFAPARDTLHSDGRAPRRAPNHCDGRPAEPSF